MESYTFDTKRHLFQVRESVTLQPSVAAGARLFTEAFRGELPESIYPDIHAITANTRTRNSTFYPKESLVGDPKTGSGFRSALSPYPIPVILDHRLKPNEETGAPSSPVLGRAKVARFITQGTGGYTSIIPEITRPDAIRSILNGELLTVSIGVDSYECYCSICGADLMEVGPGGCGHVKGAPYEVGNQTVYCMWRVGPVLHQEISFVNQPSDVQAGVTTPDVGADQLRVLAQESFHGEFGTLIDLSTGAKFLGESLYGPAFSPISKPRLYAFTERHAPSPPTKKEHSMPNTEFIPLGELYGLAADHADFGKESTLTAKQRDDLPDDAFCGPDKTFPAHDHAHAANGLARLSQYKGKGDVKKIRTCLLSKLRTTKKESTEALVTLTDPKLRVEIPILMKGASLEALATAATALPLLEADQARVYGAIVRLAESAKEPVPASLAGVAAAESDAPVSVEITEANYALLYNYLQESDSLAEEVADLYETRLAEYEATVAESLKRQAETAAEALKQLQAKSDQHEGLAAINAVEISELKAALSEAKAAQTADVTAVREAFEAKEATLKAEMTTLQEAIESQKLVAETLQNEAVRLHNEAHRSLAAQVALLKKITNRRAARDKDLPTLTQEYTLRTKQSLLDDLKELLDETTFTAGATVTTTEAPAPIVNPVLKEDVQTPPTKPVAQTRVTFDSRTGLPVLVGEIEEDDKPGTLPIMGISENAVTARIQAELAKLGKVPAKA